MSGWKECWRGSSGGLFHSCVSSTKPPSRPAPRLSGPSYLTHTQTTDTFDVITRPTEEPCEPHSRRWMIAFIKSTSDALSHSMKTNQTVGIALQNTEVYLDIKHINISIKSCSNSNRKAWFKWFLLPLSCVEGWQKYWRPVEVAALQMISNLLVKADRRWSEFVL